MRLWPPLWFTGIYYEHISEDFKHMRVAMALRFYNKNLHGIQFGGNLFSMVDPCHLMMLLRNIGASYHILDKAAEVEFIKPGKSKVTADCIVTDDDLEDIYKHTANGEKYFKNFTILIKDTQQEIIAKVIKTVYIRKK